MKNDSNLKTGEKTAETRKPYLAGSIADSSTLKNAMAYLGLMTVIVIVSLVACGFASGGSLLIRLTINPAVIVAVLMIVYYKGAGKGTDAVAYGEILYQKKERGETVSESEQKLSFHPAKGYLIALTGALPFLIPAVILSLNATIQMTDSGTLPSWMQAYTGRSDIGNALVNYTRPEAMTAFDYLRSFIRIGILPYVNLIGQSEKAGILILEKISPLLLMLPAFSFGTGYLSGTRIRTRIHTVISENNRRRIRNARKKKPVPGRKAGRNEPEQLN